MSRAALRSSAAVALLACTGATAAADCPSASLGYTVVPSRSMSAPPGAEVATRESTLAACFLSFGDGDGDQRFDFGMDYAYTRHEYDGVAGRDRDLHRLQLPLAYRRQGEDWRLDALLAPGVATSSNVFKDLGSRSGGDDFLLSGAVELRHARGPRSVWLLGLRHDRSFGESRTLPVLGLEYRPGEALGLRLAWPDPALELAISPRQTLTVDVFPAGQRWHVVSDELGESFDYRLEGWRARATWSYRLTRSLTIDVGAGTGFGRGHEFTDDAGTRIEADVDSGYLFSVGIRIGGAPLPRGRGPALPRLWR